MVIVGFFLDIIVALLTCVPDRPPLTVPDWRPLRSGPFRAGFGDPAIQESTIHKMFSVCGTIQGAFIWSYIKCKTDDEVETWTFRGQLVQAKATHDGKPTKLVLKDKKTSDAKMMVVKCRALLCVLD